MRDRIISVCFDAAAEAANCFGIRVKLQFGEADQQQPIEGEDIARREAECFVDMGLSLCGATHTCFCLTDERVGVSQISVQRQRSLVLSNALSHTVRCTLDYPRTASPCFSAQPDFRRIVPDA